MNEGSDAGGTVAGPFGEPAADPNGVIAHTASRGRSEMDRSHRQDPILVVVPGEGPPKSVDELEQEALAELAEVAAKHATRLSGSGSPWLRYLASVQSHGAPSSHERRAQKLHPA